MGKVNDSRSANIILLLTTDSDSSMNKFWGGV